MKASTLNPLMSLASDCWAEVRSRVAQLLAGENPTIRDDPELRGACVVAQEEATMHLPATIGQCTHTSLPVDDFSRESFSF